jgi:hypothetical protein
MIAPPKQRERASQTGEMGALAGVDGSFAQPQQSDVVPAMSELTDLDVVRVKQKLRGAIVDECSHAKNVADDGDMVVACDLQAMASGQNPVLAEHDTRANMPARKLDSHDPFEIIARSWWLGRKLFTAAMKKQKGE